MTNQFDAFIPTIKNFNINDGLPSNDFGSNFGIEAFYATAIINGYDNGIWWRVLKGYDPAESTIIKRYIQTRVNIEDDWTTIYESITTGSELPEDGELLTFDYEAMYWGETANDSIVPPLFYKGGVWIIPFYSKVVYSSETADIPFAVKFKLSFDNLQSLSDTLEINLGLKDADPSIGLIRQIEYIEGRWLAVFNYGIKQNTVYNLTWFTKTAITGTLDITSLDWTTYHTFDPSTEIPAEQDLEFVQTFSTPITPLIWNDNELFYFVLETRFDAYTQESAKIKYINFSFPSVSTLWNAESESGGWTVTEYDGLWTDIPFTTFNHYSVTSLPISLSYPIFNSLYDLYTASGLSYGYYNYPLQGYSHLTPDIRVYSIDRPKFRISTSTKGFIFGTGSKWVRYRLSYPWYGNGYTLEVADSFWGPYTEIDNLEIQGEYILDWEPFEDGFIVLGYRTNSYLNAPVWKTDKYFSEWVQIKSSLPYKNNYLVKDSEQKFRIINLKGSLSTLYYSIAESVTYEEGQWITEFEGLNNAFLNDIVEGDSIWTAVGSKIKYEADDVYLYDVAHHGNVFVAVGEYYDLDGYWWPLIAYKYFDDVKWTYTNFNDFEGGLYTITYVNGKWVALGNNYGNGVIVYSAIDPSGTWTSLVSENVSYNVWQNKVSFDGINYGIHDDYSIYATTSLDTDFTLIRTFTDYIDYFGFTNGSWNVLTAEPNEIYGLWSASELVLPENPDNWTQQNTIDLSLTPGSWFSGAIFDGTNTVILRSFWSASEPFLTIQFDDQFNLTASSLYTSPIVFYGYNIAFDSINDRYMIIGANDETVYEPAAIVSTSLNGPWTALTNNSTNSVIEGEIWAAASDGTGNWIMVGDGSIADADWNPVYGLIFSSTDSSSFDLVSNLPNDEKIPFVTYKDPETGEWLSNSLNEYIGLLSSIKYANGYWVASGSLGNQAAVYTTVHPAATWTANPLGWGTLVESSTNLDFGVDTWAAVVYDDLTSTSKIFKATNPESTWEEVANPYHIVCLSYQANKWIAVGYDSSSNLKLFTASVLNGTWNETYNFSDNFSNLGYPKDLIWDGTKVIVATENKLLYSNNSTLTSWSASTLTLNNSQTFSAIVYDSTNKAYIALVNQIINDINQPLVFESYALNSVNWQEINPLLTTYEAEIYSASIKGQTPFAVGELPVMAYNDFTGTEFLDVQPVILTKFFETTSGGGGGGGGNETTDLMVENFDDTTVETSTDTNLIDRPDSPRNPQSSGGSGKTPEKFIEPLRIRFQWDEPDEDKEEYQDENEGLAPGQSEAHRYYVVVQRKKSNGTWDSINNSFPTSTLGVEKNYTRNLYYNYNLPQHDPLDKAAALRNYRAVIWSVDFEGNFSDGYFNTNGTVKGQSGIEQTKTFSVKGEVDTKRYETGYTAHRNMKITEVNARIGAHVAGDHPDDGCPIDGPIRIQLLKYDASESTSTKVFTLDNRLEIEANNHKPTSGNGASGAQIENDEIDNPYLDKGHHLFIQVTAPNSTTYYGDNLVITVVMEPV